MTAPFVKTRQAAGHVPCFFAERHYNALAIDCLKKLKDVI
jgi:hypothetical protein